MQNNRDLTFDILKGILILFVVLGHAVRYEFENDARHNILFDFIYSFHMPLFVMVSGYFFYSCIKRDFMDMILNKAKRLLSPYLIWTFYLIILMTAIRFASGYYDNLTFKKFFFDFISELREYWYLLCVFILTVFYYPLFHYKEKRKFIFLILFLFWSVSLLTYNQLPLIFTLWKSYQVTRMTIIFGIGILYYLYGSNLNTTNKIIICAICCCGIILDKLYFGRWVMEYNIYQRIVDGIFWAIPSFFILYFMSNAICKHTNILNRLLVYLGQNSLGVYMVHLSVYHPMLKFYPIDASHNYFFALVYFFVLVIVSVLFIEIIKKFYKNHNLLGI